MTPDRYHLLGETVVDEGSNVRFRVEEYDVRLDGTTIVRGHSGPFTIMAAAIEDVSLVCRWNV